MNLCKQWCLGKLEVILSWRIHSHSGFKTWLCVSIWNTKLLEFIEKWFHNVAIIQWAFVDLIGCVLLSLWEFLSSVFFWFWSKQNNMCAGGCVSVRITNFNIEQMRKYQIYTNKNINIDSLSLSSSINNQGGGCVPGPAMIRPWLSSGAVSVQRLVGLHYTPHWLTFYKVMLSYSWFLVMNAKCLE